MCNPGRRKGLAANSLRTNDWWKKSSVKWGRAEVEVCEPWGAEGLGIREAGETGRKAGRGGTAAVPCVSCV